MSQGIPFFSNRAVKEAAKKGAGVGLLDLGKKAYDVGADALGVVFDIADKNRIARLKNDKTQQSEVKKLEANIQKRKAEDAQRNKDIKEINLEDKGLATRLESKDRIVKKLASNELKRVQKLPSQLQQQGSQALSAYEKQLRNSGYGDNEISQYIGQARQMVEAKNLELADNETSLGQEAVNKIASGGGVNPFAIDRVNQEFDKLKGEQIDWKRAVRTSAPVETLTRTVKPVVDMGNDIELLATTGIDKLLGTNLTKASLANIEAQKAKGAQVGGMNYADALDVDQSLGAQAQRFVGQSAPFMLAPETAIARRAGATAARMLRPGLLRNVVKAGITEGIQDTPLSTLQTVAELNRRVQTGEITGQEAMQQLPSAIGGNLIGDIGGAGLLRGAGDLANKALKGAPDVVNPTRNQKGNLTLEGQKAEAPKVLTPEDIKKAQYQKSFSRLNELAPKQKELTQAITKAQIEGDYGRVAQLKQEAKAVKEEAKYLKQTVNNLELEGLQKAQEVPKPQEVATNEAVQVNQDVENIRKILGNNQEGILPQQQPKLRQETTPVISGGRVSEPVSPSQNNLNALPTSSKGQLETALMQPQGQELGAFNNVNQGIDNLAQKAQSTEPLKSLDDPDINSGIKNKTLEPQGLRASGDPTVKDSSIVQTPKNQANEPLNIKNFTESNVINNIGKQLKEKYGEKKGNNIYDAALRLVNPSKNEIIEIRGNGVVVKENDKYLLKPFGNTDASSKKWILYRDLDITDQFEKNIIQENKTSQIKDIQTPKNQAELEQTYKETFGLDEPKAKAAAVVTDRIFDTIARRKGITKEAAYSEVGFKKSNLSEVGKGAKFQGAQTDTPEFKKWFGDSKVVDESGKPLVVYHGTNADFNVFKKTGKGGDIFGSGFYFTKKSDLAGNYAKQQKGNIKPVYLSIKSPLEAKISKPEDFKYIVAEKLGIEVNKLPEDVTELLKSKGYDGININDGRIIRVFEPTQIKSATGNSGKFDPNNPDIRFQSQKGAMETLESGKKVIHALTDPNVSTPLHEVAHVYEEVLTQGERKTILDWAGSKEWDTNASEKFARGFERYLAEGKAPIPSLKEIFEDFKDWLVDIYKGITGSEIDIKLNKQMRKIYDDMIALDPKLSESLSAKTLNKEQGLKGVRRVVYEPKAFQEAQRNPKNLSTLSEAYGDKVPKNSEKIMSEASKVKKRLNDVEASLQDNKAQLAKIMRDAKVDSVEVELDGKKYTIKRPTKPDDKVVFNNQGRLAREELVSQFQKEGKISFDADQGINLAIQTEAKAASRATKYGTKNLEEAAKEHIKFLREAAVLGEKEAVLKEKIMKDIVPSLENGGLDHVWRNNEGDTSFAIKRNPTKSNFKTPEAEAEFKAREAELKANIDNVKIQKGEYGSTGLSEAQAMGLNRRTKAGKAEYQEFQSKIRRDIEAKTALEDGIETSKQAESVIESGLEQYKKLDDGLKGKQFAFNPAMAAALLDSDAALLGLKAFKPLIDKALNKQGALVSNVYDGLKTVVGRSESYATRLRDSKIPAFRKLIEDYDNLAAREYQAEGYMRTKFSPEQVEKIGAAIKEHGFRELEDMMKGGKAIEGIESTDEMEILKAFMQNRRKRADLIKDSIEQGKKANIAKGDLALLESFYANETKTNKGTGAALQGLATDLLYFKALWNNLKSTTLVATDPLTKLVPEFGIGKTALSLKDVMDSKVRNSPLFKAYNAGASGTFVDALTARKAEGLGKVWEKIKKTSIFSAVTEASQDMGLLAHARSFNDYWKRKTGETINILDDFDGLNEASQEFALMHNALTNKLYGAGKGTIYQAEIEGNNFIKPFMAFMGEPIRFQKRMSEWRSLMAKAGEKGATEADKELGRRARNGMVTFIGMTALLGGSAALKNMGGAIGSAYNLALNLMSPEERQKTEDYVNAAQLTRYLNIDLGEKLGVSLLQRGEGESFKDVIGKMISGESRIAFLDALKQYPKDFEKMQNYFKAGNKEQAYFTMTKMLMGSAPGTVDKVLKKLNQEPISVWIEENGNMKEEFKAVDLADILSYSANETDIKKAVKMETKAKEAAIGKVEKIGKRYKLASNSREFNEYLNLLSSDRFKLNPAANRQELEQKILKAAFTKQTNQSKKLSQFAPKTSVAYLKSQSEEDLMKRVSLMGGTKKRKALQSLRQARQEASKRGRAKFNNVFEEVGV